jgi:hypothetical protein
MTLTQNIIAVIVSMAVSLLLMAGLNWLWPATVRYSRDDQVGWQLSVLGITYAVILGFMFFAEWSAFTAAALNADLEASALRNIFRLAEGLPPPQRSQLEMQTRAYAAAVLDEDWPAMASGQTPEKSRQIDNSMWKTLTSVKAGSASETTAADHALSELSTLTMHRQTRVVQSASRLPVIFWYVLLVGGVLTIISVTMFGSINPKLHTFQVSSLTLLVTLSMLAIADLDGPFRGWVHISSYAFERAQQYMR